MFEQKVDAVSNHRKLVVIGFYILAAFKLIAALFGFRILLLPSVPSPAAGGIREMIAEHNTAVGVLLITFYGLSFLLCLWLARGIKQRRLIARNIGFAYSGFHVAGVLFTVFLPILLLNALMGLLTFIGLYRGNRAGEFVSVAPRLLKSYDKESCTDDSCS